MDAYELTERADRDLLELLVYGIDRFGYAQAEAYRQDLLDCLAMIAAHPAIGRPADAVGTGVRRHEHGNQVVFYERLPGRVSILAIVHARSIRRIVM